MSRIHVPFAGEHQVSSYLPIAISWFMRAKVIELMKILNCRTEDLNRFFDEKKRPTRHTRLSQEERRQYVQLVAEHIFSGKMFRGMLVSTLTCQECNNTSRRYEEFLDLSLPTYVNKLVESVAIKRNATKAKVRSKSERVSKRNTEHPMTIDDTDEDVDRNGNDVKTEITSDQTHTDSEIICGDKKGLFCKR